jgi:hypothetical protein
MDREQIAAIAPAQPKCRKAPQKSRRSTQPVLPSESGKQGGCTLGGIDHAIVGRGVFGDENVSRLSRKQWISPQNRKMKKNRTKKPIGTPAILVTRNARTASTPKVRNIVRSRPNRSDTERQMILDRVLRRDVRVAARGTMAKPESSRH